MAAGRVELGEQTVARRDIQDRARRRGVLIAGSTGAFHRRLRVTERLGEGLGVGQGISLVIERV